MSAQSVQIIEMPKTAHIALDAVVQMVVRESVQSEPAPKLDAMELELLRQAERCASGNAQMPPRRELVAAALREVERERWWRDYAEARVEQLRQQVLTLQQGAAAHG